MPPKLPQGLQGLTKFLDFRHKEVQVLIALRLIILEFPEPFEDRSEFFVMCDGQCIGRLFFHRFLDAADAIVDGMELIMKIVK
jgi:hypothetical protein